MKTREEIIASCPIGADLDSYLHGYANGYTDGSSGKPNTPEGLDEAAEKYAKENYLDEWTINRSTDAFKAGADWRDRMLNWARDLVQAGLDRPEEAVNILKRLKELI